MLNYEEFTKRKRVTKAVRFELMPQGKTMDFINEHNDLAYDRALYDALERMKPVIDSFIKKTANEALTCLDYDFSVLYAAMTAKDRKAYDREVKAFNKAITKRIEDSMPDGYKISQIKSAKFLQEALYDYVLHTDDPDIKKDEALKDIDATKGCLPLYGKFITSRITTLTTWMPERVLKNFEIYCDNIRKLESAKKDSGYCFGGDDISDELLEMQAVSGYNSFLTQNGIDGYNRIIAGDIDESGMTFKGVNARINEYDQKVRNEKLDEPLIRKLTMLQKQILMPREKSFTIESIDTDDEVREVVKQAYASFSESAKKMVVLLRDKKSSTDGEGVFIAGNRVHQLSHLAFGDHNLITQRMIEKESASIKVSLETKGIKPSMKKELTKRLELLPALIAKKDYELTELSDYLDNPDKSALVPQKTAFGIVTSAFEECVNVAGIYYNVIKDGGVLDKRRIKGDRHVQEMLVDFFGALTDARDVLSLIRLPKDAQGDILFYDAFDELFNTIRATYKAENLVRNYITRSIKDIAKEKQTCLGTPARLRTQWWNGEKKFSKDNAAIIRHEGKYYYFVLSGDAKPIEPAIADTDTGFLRLKKGQPSFMMLPKIVFTDHAVPFFKGNKAAKEFVFEDAQVSRPVKLPRDIYDIYEKGLFKKDAVNNGVITEDEYKENIKKLIDVYKDFARAYVQYEMFNLEDLTDSGDYNDIGEFFAEIDTRTSKLLWVNIDFSQIEKLVESGEGYLFLISNRFLYTGNEDKNPYTRVFLSMLSDENMDRTTLKLNSNPVIIYRPQALEYKVTHKKGSTLVGKRTEDGEQIPRAIYESIYKIKNGFTNVEDSDYKKAVDYMKHHKVKTWAATADFSHQKRYMSDKFLLQLTYTKNNDVSDRANDMLNDRVNEAIKDGFNVISVSRSTTDMVYVMALDSDMNILEEKSLNIIDGIDYSVMLNDVYREKLEDKKAWVYDTDGKDLKSAYLELAITQVLKMARKYNAIIAVESISDTVKDKYSFLDNQVFKAFEKRITERLSDLSYKDIDVNSPGSVNNPLQMANNSGNSYQDGILFFINGAYTRGVDPATGFVNLFNLERLNSIASKRQFFGLMDKITCDGRAFTFEFDYNNFPVKYGTEKTKWTVKVCGDVTVYDVEKKSSKKVEDVVGEVLVPLAAGADLSGNLVKKITDKALPGAFVEELFKQFRYALTGMHRKTTKDDSFYRSPVTGRDYNICHTSAYNLARKLMFRMEYAGDSADFTQEWINYIQ